MTFAITATYVVALTVIMIVLNTLVTVARLKTPISLGDSGNDRLLEANRRHMNFIENVPMAVILLALAEAGGAGATVLHTAGLALVALRLIHPFGISVTTPKRAARIIGSTGTKAVQLGLCVVLLMQYFA